MTQEQILELLIGGERSGFHRGMTELRRAGMSSPQRAELCIAAADKFRTSRIGDSEVVGRYCLILGSAKLGLPELKAIAPRLSASPAAIRNAAAQFLPPELRPLLYGIEPKHDRVSTQESPSSPHEPPTPTDHFSTVALLAIVDQSANKNLLRKNGFEPVQFASLDDFERFVQSEVEICACLIDGSFFDRLPKSDQERTLRSLFLFSSFTWIRIHRAGLQLSNVELAQLHKKTCCDPRGPVTNRLGFSESSLLQEYELSNIREAQKALTVHIRGRVSPGEINDNELAVLTAAVSASVSATTLNENLEVVSLKTKFLQGGRTTAKVAEVKCNAGEVPFIAKIDTKENILDEASRFYTFVSSTDLSLHPTAYYHQAAGIIIFGVVTDGSGDPISPAPTLESVLNKLWTSQVYDSKDSVLPEDAVSALTSAVNKIAIINRRPPSGSYQSLANPRMVPFDKSEAAGLSWGLPADSVRARIAAQSRFSTLQNAASVHGDAHLRNILVRAGRESHLIDYARSGPGHPAIDLVVLELALLLSAFRQVGDSSECANLLRLLNDFSQGAEQIKQALPQFFAWRVNAVCLQGMICARDKALEIVRQYGGSEADYFAAKYLVSWEALLIGSLQRALSISMITSLTHIILDVARTPDRAER